MEKAQSVSPDQPKRQRGSVACKRCRRLRSKCSHQGRPPCITCLKHGPATATECSLPRRGDKGSDREFRAKRHRLEGSISSSAEHELLNRTPPLSTTEIGNRNDSLVSASPSQEGPVVPHDLPPVEEIVDGFRVFVTSYFQLGFLPKTIFLEKLSRHPGSISTFLLVAVLAVSARFTSNLIKRYGSGSCATSHFLGLLARMVQSEMYQPSLDRVQAFFLLSIAEWGNGEKNRSYIHMGIAVRMATILRLHREETYAISETATAEVIIELEMARRTFWMIQSQEDLHSGFRTPTSFSPTDITTLLPSDETDFAFGTVPAQRAALQNTPPALADPRLLSLPDRSLFATLVQAHNLWGMVARRACNEGDHVENALAAPWEASSQYSRIATDLREWESSLPPRQRWSTWNLRGYKAESQDLAYLSVVMVVRLANIVLRRVYLPDIIKASSNGDFVSKNPDVGNFWQVVSQELFNNTFELYEQIEAYFSLRSKEDGYPAILVFCVYVCGSLASYLWKYPQLCRESTDSAEKMSRRSLSILSELQHAWPTSKRWSAGLQQASAATISDRTMPRAPVKGDAASHSRNSITQSSSAATAAGSHDFFVASNPHSVTAVEDHAMDNAEPGPCAPLCHFFDPAFDTDFTLFLQGDLTYSFPEGWEGAADVRT